MSTISQSESVHVPLATFEDAAKETVGSLRVALAELVSHVPECNGNGGSGVRAVDIERGLELDKKRGWQLFRVIFAESPLAEVANIPGAPTMRRILATAARKNVPPDVLERAADAFQNFERFVEDHGVDRAEIVSLASGLSNGGGGDQQHNLSARKSAFRALSHLWGIKEQLSVRTTVFHPSPPPGKTHDILSVRGFIGLQRLRHGVPVTMFAYPHSPLSRETEKTATIAEPKIEGLNVLLEFSSRPLPQALTRVRPDGHAETDLVFPPSGRAGALVLYTSQHVKGTETRDQTDFATAAFVRIPTERLVLDLLVPEGWSDPATVRAEVYGRRDAVDRAYERRPEDLLPQHEIAKHVGLVEVSPPINGAPRHSEAVHHALERLGWLGVRFDMYRCTVEHPLLHTMVLLAVDAARRSGKAG